MQDDDYSLPQEKQSEINSDYLNELQEENQKLLLENAQLKGSLEKEEFLHKNLYKQWTELNAHTLNKDREVKQLKLKQQSRGNFYKYSFYALLLITVVFAWYLLANGDKHTALIQPITSTTDTTVRAMQQTREQYSVPPDNIKPERKDTVPAQTKQVVSNEILEPKMPEADKNLVQYRVKTKTFFYNKPNERTQRNIFLLPYKDSYGLVKALDDQNDFIYIVYTNHAGRTSKGWIRKIDLDLVDQ